MITIERTIRWYNNYIDEVKFCKENSFDFMQIWFKDGQIVLGLFFKFCVNALLLTKPKFFQHLSCFSTISIKYR